MKVRVRDLPVDLRLELPAAFLRETLAGLNPEPEPGQESVAGEITADLSLSAEQATVFAEGALQGWIGVTCSRCLASVRLVIDEPFHVTFLPHAAAPDHDEEVELNEEDLDVATYEGDEIDLAPQLREQILLTVPMAPLCDEACKGLCPQCGADLNQGRCSCPPLAADVRWSALKNVKT